MAETDDWDEHSNSGANDTRKCTASSRRTSTTTQTNENVENAATIRCSTRIPKQPTSLGGPEATSLPKKRSTTGERTSTRTTNTTSGHQSKHNSSDIPTPRPGHVTRCPGRPRVLTHSDVPIPPPGPDARDARQQGARTHSPAPPH